MVGIRVLRVLWVQRSYDFLREKPFLSLHSRLPGLALSARKTLQAEDLQDSIGFRV